MKSMKGQYLAVETVFIFGLGIMLATGIITVFQTIRGETLETAENEQNEIVFSSIERTLYSLKESDSQDSYSNATYQLTIPERLGGNDYTATIDDKNITLRANSETFEHRINGIPNYTVTGSFTGGDITIFKTEQQITVGNN